MSAMKNKLPSRWTEYGAVGSRIPGTRFIAFKVPLKKLFDNQLAPWQRFSVSDLIGEIQRQNEELGLIVDLTCTNRYYTQQELPITVNYEKIMTVGTQLPNDEVYEEFVRVVRRFLNENSKNDKLIGVHCTHGLNRTGYLLCRFMIGVLGMAPAKAIEAFNQSRGHNMERQNYLDDLSRRIPSWGPQISTPPFPQLPGLHIPELQHGFQWMGGGPPGLACANGAPSIPSPAFPYIPAPRQWLPHAADLHQQHFRGPQSFAPHPAIPFAWHQHNGPVNGERAQEPAPYGGDTAHHADARTHGPWLHGQNTPYSRGPVQDHQGAPRRQWQ